MKSPFGYHIIQVEAHQPGTKATLANSTDKITAMLRQQQEAPLIQPFLQSLQTKANIQITDPAFKDLFPSPPPGAPAPATTGAAPAPAATH